MRPVEKDVDGDVQGEWGGVQEALVRLLRQGSNRRPPLISINTIMAVLLRQGQHEKVSAD